MTSMHNDERETIIRFDETNNPAKIETHNKSFVNLIKQWQSERPGEYKIIREYADIGYIYAEIPRKRAVAAVKTLKPAKSRSLTDEDRKKRSESLKLAREKKAKNDMNISESD